MFYLKDYPRWNDFLLLITDYRDFRPQTCTNGLVFMECKHIKNIFEDVYFTKTSFHITLKITLPKKKLYTAEKVSTCIILVLKEVTFLALQRNYFKYVLP
jgi:hypothetical protein